MIDQLVWFYCKTQWLLVIYYSFIPLLLMVDIELPYEPQAINNPEISFLAAIGPLTSFFLCCYTRIQLDCPFAFLLFRLGPAFAGNLSSTGLLNSAFFLFAVVGLQIVNNPVKQILDIKPWLSRHLVILLGLFLCNLSCIFASVVEYLRLKVIFVADYVDLYILLACFSDEVYPSGDVLNRGHICIVATLLAKSKTTKAMWASLR